MTYKTKPKSNSKTKIYSSGKINGKTIALIVAAFAIIGVAFTFLTKAATPNTLLATIEGESMSKTAATTVAKADTSASGSQIMYMPANDKLSADLPSNKTKIVNIVATVKGTPCNGNPVLGITVDNNIQTKQDIVVDSPTLKSYSATVNIPAGQHSLQLAFSNDYQQLQTGINSSGGSFTSNFASAASPRVAQKAPKNPGPVSPTDTTPSPATDNTNTPAPTQTIVCDRDVSVDKILVYTEPQIDTPPITTNTSYWKPTIGMRFMWLLSREVNPAKPADIGDGWKTYSGEIAPNADIVDMDGFDNPKSTVDAIHAKGKKAVCYISGGTAENWRADYSSFPASVKGNQMSEWPGEYWLKLDSNSRAILLPIMKNRMQQQCKSKGFDAVEFDNVDGYSQSPNEIGITITEADQFEYNKALADIAHSLGLSAGLKNDLGQVAKLQPFYDYALNEQCNQYNECSVYNNTFLANNKPTFVVEYNKAASTFCPAMNNGRFDAYQMNLQLDGSKRITCR